MEQIARQWRTENYNCTGIGEGPNRNWRYNSAKPSTLCSRVLDYTIGYVDEAILSYSLLHPNRNPWETSREGLILYAQNWRTILGSGLVLAAMSYGVVALIAGPGILISYVLTGAANPMGIGVSVALGFFVKFVVMDPFALTAVIVNYHEAIANKSCVFGLPGAPIASGLWKNSESPHCPAGGEF